MHLENAIEFMLVSLSLCFSDINVSICPAMRLDCKTIIDARNACGNQFGINAQFKIDEEKVDKYKTIHTINFGEFPKTYVETYSNEYLELKLKNGELHKTGKRYIGHMNSDGTYVYNDEYDINVNELYFLPMVGYFAKSAGQYTNIMEKEIRKRIWSALFFPFTFKMRQCLAVGRKSLALGKGI